MELRNIEAGDLPLYEAIHCDPRMMEHLGGPLPREGLADKLQRDVATTEAGDTWVLKIDPDDVGTAAGTVAVWDHEIDGETVTEIGWMVLPQFQGRGLGSEAVRAVLDRARSEGRWSVINAYPPVTNAASNAMCRSMGFTLVEERDFVWRGRPLRCNHWRLDLRSAEAV
jgi:RimJ/RimL family protein N-acetyltransferase